MANQDILIGLHRGRGLIGRLIQWQTRSVYSHASIYVDGTWFESREFHGVRPVPLLAYCEEEIDWFSLAESASPSLSEIRTAQAWARYQMGKGYDYTSVLRFLSRRQASRKSSGRWFCSELVFAILRKAGVHLLQRIEPWAVSPGHLSLSPLLAPVDLQDLPASLRFSCNTISPPIQHT